MVLLKTTELMTMVPGNIITAWSSLGIHVASHQPTGKKGKKIFIITQKN